MTIDGEDILEYGALQWNVTMGYPDISNTSDWAQGSLMPLMLPGKTRFKEVKVYMILKGSSREEIWKNGSRLISRLLQPSIIQLDGFSNKFYAVLVNASQAERSIKRWHKVTLKFNAYEYGDEISKTTSERTLIIQNPGNLDTPAVVEIVPIIGKTSITITGIARNRFTGEDKPVTVKKLKKDKKIVIDGEKGLIMEEGTNKYSDVELWDLPSLKPGMNMVTINQDLASMTIKFKPRYL